MSKIIAGRFDQQTEIDSARTAFQQAGIPAERIASFFVTPAGQHDRFALGGDDDKSRGAQSSDSGVAAGGPVGGGTLGLAVGAAAFPLVGPAGLIAGALVGAHIGTLVGSLSQMDDDGGQNTNAVRHAGMLFAVSVPDQATEQHAVALLRDLGARDIEQSQGQILGGDWPDFDPTRPPQLVATESNVDRVDFNRPARAGLDVT